MKTLSLICVLLFSFALSAQVEFKSISLNNPDLNILYAGIENFVKIEGVDIDSSYQLTSSTGEVYNSKGRKNSDYCLKHNRAKGDTLRLYQGEVLVQEEVYEVRLILWVRRWLHLRQITRYKSRFSSDTVKNGVSSLSLKYSCWGPKGRSSISIYYEYFVRVVSLFLWT